MSRECAGTVLPARNSLQSSLLERLRSDIFEGRLRQGERLPPLRDLAGRYGMSFSSARLAVNRLEQLGLVYSIQGSGTYVKAQVTPAATIPGPAYLFLHPGVQQFGELADHLAQHLQDCRILPLRATWNAQRGVEQLDHMIDRWRLESPSAIVVQGIPSPELDDAINRHASAGTRRITLLRRTQFILPGWHSINPDYATAFRLAGEYLLKLGHQRVGLVTKPRRVETGWVHTRRKAFMWHTEEILSVGHVMREAGIHGGLTIHYNHSLGLPEEEDIARLVEWLSRPDRPTAIVADDFRLIGVKAAAKRLGMRVPEDLMLVGVGGNVLGEVADFPVVSLRYDLIAAYTAQLIATPLNELGEAARHVVVPPQFQPRDPEPANKPFRPAGGPAGESKYPLNNERSEG